MTDFDFEELDKAVTGALGSTDSQSVRQDASSPTSTPQDSQQKPEEAPVVQGGPAARRAAGGRFMDMVHPSSDMRQRSGAPSSANRAPQQPIAEASRSKTLTENKPTASPAASPWSAPLESPFLPDAKVEKRPLGTPVAESLPEVDFLELDPLPAPPDFSLGSFGSASAASGASFGGESLPAAAPAPLEPIDILSDIPPVEAVETENAPTEEAIEGAKPADAVTLEDDQLLLEEPDDPRLEASNPSVEVEPARIARSEPQSYTAPDIESVGSPSITQQYKEQPRTDVEPGAIYDTEAYHQPLSVPAKKRSAIGLILWTLLLIALGAGVGVMFYLYILPEL